MPLGVLMIIVTLLEGGQYSAAFVNTATQEECTRRATVVRTILETGGTPIAQVACLPSHARFSRYVHSVAPDAPRWQYAIQLDADQAIITPIAPGVSCATPSEAPAGSHYCASSTQSLQTDHLP